MALVAEELDIRVFFDLVSDIAVTGASKFGLTYDQYRELVYYIDKGTRAMETGQIKKCISMYKSAYGVLFTADTDMAKEVKKKLDNIIQSLERQREK